MNTCTQNSASREHSSRIIAICREKEEVREEEADLCAAYLERHFPHGSFQSSSQALGRYALSKPREALPSWKLPIILPGSR
jgi:hypothetical protein